MQVLTHSVLDDLNHGSRSRAVNRRIVLKSRPVGAPSPANFRLEELTAPVPLPGQVLMRTLYLSLDPYMRIGDASSDAAPVAVGEVMAGGTVSRVEVSRHPDYRPGDLVLGYNGWQQYALSDGTDLAKLDANMTRPSLTLGALGVPGFTAYIGLLDIGRPKAGETVVVAATSGVIGSLAGQIAKLKGCRVVVIASSADRRRFLVEELGFDVCIDRRSPDLSRQLAVACPKGVDVYFENAGGAVFDAVLPLLNHGARVPLRGLMAQYDDNGMSRGQNRLTLRAHTLLTRRIRMQGFFISDYRHRYGEFFKQMSAWIREGRVKAREDIVNGLENAPLAFIKLLEGKWSGRLIIRVSNDRLPSHLETVHESHQPD
jgi:NADPH-dependent curcumin reductase